MPETQVIAAIGTAIVAPIIAYLKVRDERQKTGDKRDTQIALIDKRISDCEKKMSGIDDLKDAVAKINNSLTKIETILELYINKINKLDK